MFEKKKIRDELKTIDKSLENQENWTDHTKTGKYLKKRNYIQGFLNLFDDNCSSFSDIKELVKLSQNEKNEELLKELQKELESLTSSLNSQYLETLMVGKADSKNVILEINSGPIPDGSPKRTAILFLFLIKFYKTSLHFLKKFYHVHFVKNFLQFQSMNSNNYQKY